MMLSSSISLHQVSIPTMIVYGALDPKGKSRADILHQIPNSHVDVFE
jgi:hypothetical protein